ncbi:MAG TPA: TAXI family TRAP transporter solute-binding subunit [Burkholderiales bacterium]|nr:TAXI family TRAP transporter solute-binding subunit [Burkholderiales bacterium]
MIKRAWVLLAAGLMTAWGSAAWSQTDIRWATSAVGSAGHKALVTLAGLLGREMPKYRITVLPTPGAIVSVKGYATGEYDGYYGADIAFYQLAHDSGRFKGFKASMKRMPVQSFWTFTTEMGIGVRADELKTIKNWHDLDGKTLFLGNPPWDTRAQLERAFAALGVKYQYRQVDLSSAGSSLQRGDLDGICIYTTGEAAVAPWVQEAGMAADWGVVNPSASEIATLRKAGFAIFEQSAEAFHRNIHADKAILLPYYYGFHVGMEIPADDVYRMLKIIEQHAGELAKADKSFSQIAKDMPGFQRQGVTAAADLVPIHPGLAKYMREKGVWDPKWDSRVAKQ